ncbi:MAG: hypothetical protein A3G20_06600 [Acidobacteria bacterium RIFCSPLOWO2_12_FULL_59_11]|nr:MAG: hypothetical protein A3G20_06600 [Acidobacteria bacterium RIFCSPLOWO2_12_FULL_59_11]
MTVFEWLAQHKDFIAVAAGIIGMVTGSIGIILAVISYRRTSLYKKLDLRLDLRKLDADLNEALAQLTGLLTFARDSRERITAATGQTGAWQHWIGEFDVDCKVAQGVDATFKAAPKNYRGLSDIALEEKLVESHRLRTKVDQLIEK